MNCKKKHRQLQGFEVGGGPANPSNYMTIYKKKIESEKIKIFERDSKNQIDLYYLEIT